MILNDDLQSGPVFLAAVSGVTYILSRLGAYHG